MRTELSDEARDLEGILEGAFRKAGGFEPARKADAGAPVDAIRKLLEDIGIWDLRPRESEVDGEAAAVVCRAAGRWALPYPVAERLAGGTGADAIAVVPLPNPRINLADVDPDLRWTALDGDGRRAPVVSVGPRVGSRLGALTCPVEVGEWGADEGLAPLALTLPCWVLLGMAEEALRMTRRHLLDREQFGKPLAAFQALQFQLADTAASLQGFEELAKYTLWSVLSGQPGAAADAVALRMSAIEVAETVFRTGHQMFGAMGFCDETDLSWLSRCSQPIRRLPWGRSQTQARLLRSVEDVPFAGLFADLSGDVLVHGS
ncbi:acyl-CoA dehydrogenase [Amycolatopsis sp. K13G38]|uniref:Acyl-CoA dehydrogenase n=1 Tax=Amycolatopsis acididurans TaxID=2724524 RepID=A0ABX1JAK5_9PSEU|nr:acyl-CoA dehydrogenase family protein [Amycolatopsis acididurans]NKQ56723.1 acyl-CoA dehydrogenase [Amycolatopsis acididurans]